jgi:hypothetical protein
VAENGIVCKLFMCVYGKEREREKGKGRKKRQIIFRFVYAQSSYNP